jgi:hypothetical protein
MHQPPRAFLTHPSGEVGPVARNEALRTLPSTVSGASSGSAHSMSVVPTTYGPVTCGKPGSRNVGVAGTGGTADAGRAGAMAGAAAAGTGAGAAVGASLPLMVASHTTVAVVVEAAKAHRTRAGLRVTTGGSRSSHRPPHHATCAGHVTLRCQRRAAPLATSCGHVASTWPKFSFSVRRVCPGAATMMQPQIILLREGTDTSQGRGQLISNINACQAVTDTVRSTLGPRGMDKLIVDSKGGARVFVRTRLHDLCADGRGLGVR